MTTIHILSPISHHRHPQADRSLKDLIRQMSHFEWKIWEVTGRSEVTRARNHVATAAYPEVKHDDLVFWLDADIVIKPLTFAMHVALVAETELAISGRYVKRQDPSRIAASWDDEDKRTKFTRQHLTVGSVDFFPIMCGMGALLMTGPTFILQADTSVEGKTKSRDGRVFREKIVCSNPIVTKNGDPVMLSEDFDYCSRIPDGVWMVQYEVGGKPVSLDYGHVTEQVIFSSGPITFKDDR